MTTQTTLTTVYRITGYGDTTDFSDLSAAATLTWRIEKRVANTAHWGFVGREATRAAAAEFARHVLGGHSTGVRIVRDGDPYAASILIIGR